MSKNSLPFRLMLAGLILAGLIFSLGAQEKRFALVIGNATYGNLGNLKNPLNDATDMAAALKRVGFTVDLLLDAELVSMEDAAIRLRDRLATDPESMGLFYYAGHGIQSKDGSNYLIPSKASISDEAFLKTRALPAQTVLELMQSAGNKINLVFLDACRDNPFAWSRSTKRGLSIVGNQPPGSIIVYATSAGSTAADGTGRNGVFTGELLKNLETPGIDLDTVLNRTAQGVIKATKSEQNPAIYKQYFGSAYLKGQAPEPTQAPVAVAATTDGEMEFGAIAVATGKLEIKMVDAGTISLLGKSVQAPAGSTVPVNKVKAGEITVEVTFEDGTKSSRTVTIKADQTSSLSFARGSTKEPAGPAATPQPGNPLILAGVARVPPKRGNFVAGQTWRGAGGITMMAIMGGSFQMGNPGGESDEKPVHQVGVTGFYLSNLEVTQAQWEEVMGTNPSYFKGKSLPVERVTWFDAIEFCNRLSALDGLEPAYVVNGTEVTWNPDALGYRLPTEAEWEYAARGGSRNMNTPLPYAGSLFPAETAWFAGNSGSSTHPVGQKKVNQLGLYDLSGNVAEWCWDWYGPYDAKYQFSHQGPASGNAKVLRGGSWNGDTAAINAQNRMFCAPDLSNHNYGLRIAASQ